MNTLNAFLPEIILTTFVLINIVLSLFINKHSYKISKILTIFGIFSSMISLIFTEQMAYQFIFKTMILISALLVIFCTNELIREKRNRSFEYFSIFLTGLISSFILISSNNFLTAFVAIELLGISCYFLTGFRKNHKSKEASLKYLITGASASAFFLLGVSYLYGITGNIDFMTINRIIIEEPINLFFICACIPIIVGTLFKLGCLPFTNWVVDIYDGANYQTGFYLSLIPKIAAIAFINNLFITILGVAQMFKVITAFIALLTIIYASFGALKQTNIKRIYAYSSIIHAGFLLLAISTVQQYSLSTVIFYLITYIFMNAGIWYVSTIYNTELKSDELKDYKGLFYKHPYFSIAYVINLIALAGLPPTSGFLAKLYLFTAISRSDLLWIIILLFAMISTIFSMFVYFKIIKQLFIKSELNISIKKQNTQSKIVLYICTIVTILLCIFPDTIIKLSQITAFFI